MNTISINNLDEIHQAATDFLSRVGTKKHFAFYGSMGAGKTTFIKALCDILKVTDNVSSPSFAIVNEYQTEKGDSIFHFDFYRIKSIEEVFNLGYEDYFYASEYCFVEWPELVEELLPDHFIKVNIQVLEDGKRQIEY
jgi:tRNA threonylcarbamoyladenosine biosynthesis protein TsaE